MRTRDKTVSELLIQYRLNHKWSLRECAHHIGVSHQTIKDIERGCVKTITPSTAKKLAPKLNRKWTTLLCNV